jgi:hypothetical protein
MSFSIYVSTIRNSETDTFDRSVVERAFKDIILKQTGDSWNVYTPDGYFTSAVVFIKDKPQISSFSVNRPALSYEFPKFWSAMFEILSQTRTVLFWPTGGPRPHSCIADPALILDLTDEWTRALGKPAVVSSGAEVEATLAHSMRAPMHPVEPPPSPKP